MVSKLGEVMWVVDLNRQSLDRVVPDIAAGRLQAMFEAAGWHSVMVKYGPRLAARPELRGRIDLMPNEEYQRLLRAPASELRERLEVDTGDLEDAELLATFRDLGGHDLGALIDGYRQADAVRDRPSVVFAYTIKGWTLPTEGHPANHSALLTEPQYEALAERVGADPEDPWAPFPDGSAAAELCAATARRLAREDPPYPGVEPPAVPAGLGRDHRGAESTQQAFGRFFVDLEREAPDVADRVVTVSPDVGTSTNLGGWINKAGIWSTGDRIDWFADDTDTLVRWRESDHGRHIELGIAEVNLVGLLGELGATWSRSGQPLLPVGTIYDPFVARALEPWSFGIYAGGQSILVGTPSGVTLGPEGGAHQSVITPSIGIEQPGCVAYEPAFGQDLEWILLHALSRLGRPGGESAYLRLSTRPLDQALHNGTREEAIAGGYRLREQDYPQVAIAVMGALVPEAVAAADVLAAEAGIAAEVVCITSADLLFRSFQARSGLGEGDPRTLPSLFPHDVPIVTLVDGHPHTLAFLGGRIACLGVQRFGQSGDLEELYEHHQIDAESVVGRGAGPACDRSWLRRGRTIRASSPVKRTCGSTATTSRSVAQSSSSVADANAASCSSCLIVGKTSSSSPRPCASSAPAGVCQPRSTISPPSTRGSWSGGARARKKWVSKRILICGGVIQRENFTSAAGSGSRSPDSSSTSRTAATRCDASPSPSCASTAPPGNTQTPPMKRAPGLRRSSSTSRPASSPRSTITLAAWRGSAGAPVLNSSSGAGPSTAIRGRY